jgi:glycosyltransferase involved in cell wall biosynthesis
VRILHLTSFIHGSAGVEMAELALGQKRAGHAISIVTSKTPHKDLANAPELLGRLDAGGIDLHQIDSLAARQTVPNADVVQFIHDHLGTAAAFGVLHTHSTVASVIAIAAARKVTARVPILQTTHDWRVGRGASSQPYDLEVMNLVDRAVVPTWAVAEHFASRGVVRRQLAVVPYGVPKDAPAAAEDALTAEMRAWRADGGVVLGYMASAGSTYDQRLLVNALPHIEARHRVLCVVFGTAADGSSAMHAAGGENVRVRPAATGRPVRPYLHEIDFLVLPSGDGNQPLAVLEAFCDQVPVVASRVPELSEFIEDGRTGWLFDPTDPRALAETIALVHGTPQHSIRALCQRARVLYQSEFTVDRMVSGYMREYARLA